MEAEIARLKKEGRSYEHLVKSATSIEMREGIPENPLAQKKHVVYVDIDKQIPRPDLLKALKVQAASDPEAISQEGLSQSFEKCAKFNRFYRQPCYEWAKIANPEPKMPDSYSQPGEYRPINMDRIKPKLRLAGAFERKPKEEFDLAHKSQAPPVGTYDPKDECLAKFNRVVNPGVKTHFFGAHDRTRSLAVLRTEAEVAHLKANGLPYDHLLKGSASSTELTCPDNRLAQRRPIVLLDIGRQLSRSDLIRRTDRDAEDKPASTELACPDNTLARKKQIVLLDIAKQLGRKTTETRGYEPSTVLSSPENKLAKKKPIVLLDISKQLPRAKAEIKQAVDPSQPPGGYTLADGFRASAIDKRMDRQPCYRIQ
jgi:hypothetical protein